MRGSIVFYRSFYEAVKDLPPEEYKAAIEALFAYAFDEQEVAETTSAKMFLTLVKPQVDKNNQRYENGKRGGRPRKQGEANGNQTAELDNQTQTKEKPNENQSKPKAEKSKPNVNVNVNDNVNVYKNIIGFLNECCGTAYRDASRKTRSLIDARLAEGFTEDDFRKVIRKKCNEWKKTEMARYLRPETLFGTKFESYLNAPEGGKKKSGFDFSEQRDYDFKELEAKLLARR